MEFLSVGRVKLKVILDEGECREYGIERLENGDRSPQIRESVRRILAAARESVTFFTMGERLFVQVYPLPNNGAELFVTKLSAIPESERRVVSESGIMTYLGRAVYYKFPDMKTLFRLSTILGKRECDLYLGNDGAYYLATEESLSGDLSDCDVLSEFGERIHKLPLGINTEWGTTLLLQKPLESIFT